jgi:hypothetical protein
MVIATITVLRMTTVTAATPMGSIFMSIPMIMATGTPTRICPRLKVSS